MNKKPVLSKAIFLAVLVQLLILFTVTGCGLYGPSDNSTDSSTDTRLIGTWVDSLNETYNFTFDSSYTFKNGLTAYITGSYAVDNTSGTLTLYPAGGSSTPYYYTISADENTLTIYYLGTTGATNYTKD